MCQSLVCGGKRCAQDNSQVRRHRRKVTKLLTNHPQPTPKPSQTPPHPQKPANSAPVSIEETKLLASHIKETIKGGAKKWDTETAYIEYVEKQIIVLGTQIGEHADNLNKIITNKSLNHSNQFDSYQQILKQIRPMGGEVVVNEKLSDPETVQLIQQTVGQHYPTEWLNQHNSYETPMTVITGDGRSSHYEGLIADGTKYREGTTNFWVTDSKIAHNKVVETAYENTEKLSIHINHSTQHPNVYMAVFKPEYKETFWNKTTPPPKNAGWEQKISPNTITHLAQLTGDEKVSENELGTKMLEPVWVKKTVPHPNPQKMCVLTIEKGDNTNMSKQNVNAIIYHEFGHRMENVNPFLPKLQKQFLARRANKTDKNWYSNMKMFNNSYSELVHEGDFVNKYVGKDYLNNKSFEVFTTGVEALFGGTNGALIGDSEQFYKTDLDHRAFTLGVLAAL